MKMKLVIDPASQKELEQVRRRIEHGLPQLARQGQVDAQTMAVLGAEVSIYLTTAGRVYKRSGKYLASIFAASAVNGLSVEVTVGDTAEYARDLEYGLRGTLNPMAAEQLAQALGAKADALYLGRTGEMYTIPAPTITRAAVFAGLRMVNSLETLIQAAVK